MADTLVILCPGQGAQSVGMSRAWAEASAEARMVFEEADLILGGSLGTPLSRLCFEGPEETLARTDVSQPAIFTASVACFRGWIQLHGLGPGDPSVEAAAGLSLGEYTALHIAGAFDFEHALKLVALRGRAMQEAAEASPSGMVALIGADEDKANEVCARARGRGEVLVPANFNAPGQVVISGSLTACERAESVAQQMGLRATRLQVAGAFHSPLMQPAADRLGEALADTPIHMTMGPVMSNVTAEPHRNPDGIRRGLYDQLTSPVRWAECCEFLVRDLPRAEYHELGPGKTLAGLMRRISRDTKVISHDTP